MLFSSRTESYGNDREVPRDLRSEILYDPDNIVLFGRYAHEIAAYRAKRAWHQTFSAFFLLEEGTDYTLEVIKSEEDSVHTELSACFYSACGRYAFWRLTNEQAPEAQYLLESAHIPNSEMNSLDFLTAPDLSQIGTGVSGEETSAPRASWLSPIRNILRRFQR
ncbi:MAG: hypothetical protein KDD64_08635 [Bdellovibrionales bacterium]|nr:hypothetical protein [Bdellovibrionales bacterium]